MELRLGFYYHVPAALRTGQIVMPGYQGCFVDSLAASCDKLICFLHSPVPQDHFTGDYPLRSPNVELVDIGPHTSVPHRTLYAHRFTRPLVERRNELDALLVRGPSPLLPAFARAAGSLPLVLLIVGDYLAGVDDLPQPAWRKQLIRLWSLWNTSQQHSIAKRSLVFVNSHKLYQDLSPSVPHLLETRTTTLSNSDFFLRADTCQAAPYHLLYTGRMDRAKGLSEMVSALALLVEQRFDCLLDLVGMMEKGDPILTEIHQQAINLGISERVIYHGYKPLGPELNEFYRKADIYLIASKSSFEGFPRTIWEAMANCLPVVATRVGSIPDFVEDAAELIRPRDATQLALAISKLIDEPQYRRTLIHAGYQLAQKNTLEVRSLEMVHHIEEYLSNQGK